jgi:RluA family pseudouridine synthase
MKSFLFKVDSTQSGKRLDVYLLEQIGELSRRKIRSIIDVGGVYVNKKRVRIASRAVTVGDAIRVEYNEAALKKVKAESFSFGDKDIIFAKFGVFAVNKPPGLPSQATRDQSVMHVVPVLEKYLRDKKIRFRPLILVHRLDKETSGLLLVGEGNERATWLTEQFRERKVKKTYYAVCHGIPAWTKHTEKAPLTEIDKKSGMVSAVRSGGRSALTHFKLLAVNQELGLSLIECTPETGRSHQIRVHLEINGLPIVGDKRYGSAAQKRPLPDQLGALTAFHHFLHAKRLEFQPAADQDRTGIEAVLPERMLEFCGLVFPGQPAFFLPSR